MKTIVVCSSASFYKQAVEVQSELATRGYAVLVPDTAEKMKQSGDYDVSHYKTWFGDVNDYPKKAALMRGHFDKVAAGDAILVLNYEKHGKTNYIGGNVLMEMALAFHLKKPIFVLNDVPEDSPFLEEILGMQPTFLHSDLEKFDCQ